MKARRPLRSLAWWPVLFGIWVLLITVRSPAELLIGVGSAAVAAAGMEAARRAGVVRFKPRAGWFAPFARVPWRIVAETVTVFAELPGVLRDRTSERGSLRAIAFQGGAELDARSQARRALALWLASSSPNTIALGIDVDGDVLVVHELRTTDSMPSGTSLAEP